MLYLVCFICKTAEVLWSVTVCVSWLGPVTGVSAGRWFLYRGALLMMMGTLACSYTVAIRVCGPSVQSYISYILDLCPTNMGKSDEGFLTVKQYLTPAARNNEIIQLDFGFVNMK